MANWCSYQCGLVGRGWCLRQSGRGLGGTERQASLRAGVPGRRLLSKEIGAKLRLFGRACLSCLVCDVRVGGVGLDRVLGVPAEAGVRRVGGAGSVRARGPSSGFLGVSAITPLALPPGWEGGGSPHFLFVPRAL